MEEKTEKRGRPKGSKDITPRRKRTDLANFGQEYVEAGDNTKYLNHAMAVMNMPPIDRKDINQVENRINEYLVLCATNDMKPTVSGFCNSLGIGRTTLFEWKRGTYREDTHQAVILKAYALLEELWENYMQNGKINPVSGIFLGKNNFGYNDTQEVVLTPNQQQITEEDVKTIEAKYAALPDIIE